MCGIAGCFGPQPRSQRQVDHALALMARRGPDGNGSWSGRLARAELTLLHSRLAIIDLTDRAAQPFQADDCVLTFNGEIYNYLELRQELKSLGQQFATDSDTEVIVKAYRAWGTDCVGRFEGMFAFALADLRSHQLLLARDAFGEKPLFYGWDGEGLFFGSQVKFLQALGLPDTPVDIQRMRRFIGNGYRTTYADDGSFFEGVKQLSAGGYALLDLPGLPEPKSHWSPHYAPVDMSLEEAVEGVRERFLRSVELRLRADVPIALTLSGGVDSNVLAAVAIKHFGRDMQAFSIVEQEEDYNEEPYIKKAVKALGCPLHAKRVQHDDFIERMGAMTRFFDAPITGIGMYLDGYLAESVREAGFKVSISGLCADELFTGYYDHYLYWLAGRHGSVEFDGLVEQWWQSHGRWVRNPLLRDPLSFVKDPDARGHLFLNAPDINEFLHDPVSAEGHDRKFCDDLLRDRMLNELRRETVPVYLFEGDLNWMYRSIENRTPFLDRPLVEFLSSVPSRHLIHNGFTKYLLRQIGEGVVAPEVLNLKRKTGFNASMSLLLNRNDPDINDLLLSETPLFDIIRREHVEYLLDASTPIDGHNNLLFCLVSAQMFYLGLNDRLDP